MFVCDLHVRTKVLPLHNELSIQRPKNPMYTNVYRMCVCVKAGKRTEHCMNKVLRME